MIKDIIDVFIDKVKNEVIIKINKIVYKKLTTIENFDINLNDCIKSYLDNNEKTYDDVNILISEHLPVRPFNKTYLGNIDTVTQDIISAKILSPIQSTDFNFIVFVGQLSGGLVMAYSNILNMEFINENIENFPVSIADGIPDLSIFPGIERNSFLHEKGFGWNSVAIYSSPEEMEYCYINPSFFDNQLFFIDGKTFYSNSFIKRATPTYVAVDLIIELIPKTIKIIFPAIEKCYLDYVFHIPIDDENKNKWIDEKTITLTPYAEQQMNYAKINGTGRRRYTIIIDELLVELIEFNSATDNIINLKNNYSLISLS